MLFILAVKKSVSSIIIDHWPFLDENNFKWQFSPNNRL
jgi:hypothetical protein